MAFYDEMAAMALELITEFGQAVTVQTVTPGQYDPETSQTAPDVITTQTAQGVLVEYTGREFQANSLILQGDKKLKIAAKGITAPTLLSKVIIQGKTWSIVPPLKEANPAGTPLVYELQVRA
jgi:hypothetical protein